MRLIIFFQADLSSSFCPEQNDRNKNYVSLFQLNISFSKSNSFLHPKINITARENLGNFVINIQTFLLHVSHS